MSDRRERRNQQTRDAIVRAACELILERGYEATTMTEIAERADVARRTVHGWFSSKEDIVLGAQPGVERMTVALREGRGDVVERILRQLEDEADHYADELLRLRLQALTTDPHLRALERRQLEDAESLIAEVVARDCGLNPDSLAARAFAAATLRVLLDLRSGFVQGEPRDAEEGFAFLRSALAALL